MDCYLIVSLIANPNGSEEAVHRLVHTLSMLNVPEIPDLINYLQDFSIFETRIVKKQGHMLAKGNVYTYPDVASALIQFGIDHNVSVAKVADLVNDENDMLQLIFQSALADEDKS